MKEYWQKFKEWYAVLDQRERRAVNIGGTALAIAILYFGIWSPFLGRVDGLRQRMAGDQKTLAWMQEADQKIKQLAGSSSASSKQMTPVALLAFLQNQVNQAGLKDAMKEMKQAANDSIQMQFKNVSFDQLIKLLMTVLKESHVTITQFSAIAEKTPGMVNADILIGTN